MRRFLLLILFGLVLVAPLGAQNDGRYSESLLEWFAWWRSDMLVSGMDSGYIAIPEKPWLASLNCDLGHSYFGLVIPNALSIGTGRAHFYSDLYAKLSVGAYYRGWGLSLGRGLSSNPETHFTVTSYGQVLGIDFNYNQIAYMKCDFSISDDERRALRDEQIVLNKEDACFSSININTYYVFNSMRFSYGSALGQSAMQLQSAGSLLAGLSYYQSSLDFGGSVLAEYLLADRAEIDTRQVALGMGYGYNYVPESNGRLLFHASLMPMLLLPIYNSVFFTPKNHVGIKWDDATQAYFNERRTDFENYAFSYTPSVLFLFRWAAYWNLTPSIVLGLTGMATAYPALRSHRTDTYSIQWSMFSYLGYRF